ncbi:MAG: magnesium/cobalt transporter CorA, partial [Gammaproteobacteria bacterium]|nr:magnesium/cobalt transporter CorA [Gammaproteobacteria bacterium]
NIFSLVNGRLFQEEINQMEELANFQPIWVDLEDANPQELQWVREYFGVFIPENLGEDDLEESARFYEDENGDIHLRCDFLIADHDLPKSVRVVFVVNLRETHRASYGILFSAHKQSVPIFRLLRLRARRSPGFIEDSKEMLLKLLDADIEYSADALEAIYDKLEIASKQVLGNQVTDQTAAEILATIGHQEDLNGRIRRNVMDTRRAISFMMRLRVLNAEQIEDARQLLRDLESLDSHTAFLFEKINFLLDATVGFININQNKVIKIFSVATVALLPPTLVASIYGMNFVNMPELRQEWGYYYVLLLMLISAVLPMWYFHHRGWLK